MQIWYCLLVWTVTIQVEQVHKWETELMNSQWDEQCQSWNDDACLSAQNWMAIAGDEYRFRSIDDA